jgi:glycosyltransferase involved in cell wall biosynthesis
MNLDVVVPTYKRSQLLRRTIASLLKASIPAGLNVTILVVDNNSNDDTEAVVHEIAAQSDRSIVYVKETKQGLSHARNGGIAAGTGDIIGLIDDDEEVDDQWFEVIAREFSDPSVNFIGGPCLGNWEIPAPDWLPPGYHSVIGVILPKPRAAFGQQFSGILMGGNAVIRRKVFDQIGAYSTRLGRSGKGLLSEEDAEFYRRLLAAAIHGMYIPELIIYHFIPAERLTRKYYRRWCYWRAVSQGVLDRELKEPVPYIFGIPRHRIGRAVRSMLSLPQHLLSNQGKGKAFASELATWDLCGFIYGKHFIHIEGFYADRK